MILLYHKVALIAPTPWWVSAEAFDAQMADLQAHDVVTLDDYDPSNPRHAVITFDGVYENIYQVAFPILQKWGYPFELFVIGAHIGGDNRFDSVEPLTRFATMDQLIEMIGGGGRLQWHTRTHRRTLGLPRRELEQEITVPDELRARFQPPHWRWFAYPHGEHDADAIAMVRRDFAGALSCNAGSELDRYQLNRVTAIETSSFRSASVSVIVANYNYAPFLAEAIESVLDQTQRPDEILVIDDGSTDESRMIAERYRSRVNLVFNDRNLGIVANFNKAVSLTSGDYIAILGADNTMRVDYVEQCRAALDRNRDAAIAYTDMTLFGGRASETARLIDGQPIGRSIAENWPIFLWRFPEPSQEILSTLHQHNFMHGSSMYRRIAFEQVGGYRDRTEPEDHDLFRRMIAAGWGCVRVPAPLIAYRQHSLARRTPFWACRKSWRTGARMPLRRKISNATARRRC